MAARLDKHIVLRIGIIIFGVLALAALATLIWLQVYGYARTQQAVTERNQLFASKVDIDRQSLNQTQQKIVSLLEQEFAAQPKGTKYTEGRDEYWCADFVSWIMKEAGVPVMAANGSWRIDDVPPLIAYYRSQGRLMPPNESYTPKVGDVVLFQPPGHFGNHANIVIKNQNGILTTVGGNENNMIRIQSFDPSQDPSLVGYGVFETPSVQAE